MKPQRRYVESHYRSVRIKMCDKWIEHFEACPDAAAQYERHPGGCADTGADLLT